ncbi:MAG: hypothetical protein R2940_07250 [Syntrophotaleaceae bacterium]
MSGSCFAAGGMETDRLWIESAQPDSGSLVKAGESLQIKARVAYELTSTPTGNIQVRAVAGNQNIFSHVYPVGYGEGVQDVLFPSVLAEGDQLLVHFVLMPDGAIQGVEEKLFYQTPPGAFRLEMVGESSITVNPGQQVDLKMKVSTPNGYAVPNAEYVVSLVERGGEPDFLGQAGQTRTTISTDDAGQAELRFFPASITGFGVDRFPQDREIQFVTRDGEHSATIGLKLLPGPAVPAKTLPRVERIYLLKEKETVENTGELITLETFPLDTGEIFVLYEFANLQPPAILKASWLDAGRNIQFGEVPMLIPTTAGRSRFTIRQPNDGWAVGRYQVTISWEGTVLKTIEFSISN